MPTISVIVPVYNVEEYLDRCIESILAQTFTDFELILVDDGSSDSSGEICDKYSLQDSRVIVIHKQNSGVSEARNAGLARVHGEYVTFCDSDDYYDVSHLSDLYATAKHENADIVISNYTKVDDRKNILKISNHTIDIIEVNENNRWEYLQQYVLSGRHGWEVWTRLIRSNIIKEHGISFFTGCKNYGEDCAFSFECSLFANKICSIADYGYRYYDRSCSMMNMSKSVVKIDEMNEVSAYLFTKYNKVFPSKFHLNNFAIFHFLILFLEYAKIIGTKEYQNLPQYLSNLSKYDWCIRQAKTIFKCKKTLTASYGKKSTCQILLFSKYCVHQNWNRFKIQSAIAYKFFIKGD